ncbi:MAG TPA: T9SS type B sorting domain-containing protein [Saprospiraceae bacterium]|nr:T9SS type B sorting domain-containing protein [Saprospiraceae bacterium]
MKKRFFILILFFLNWHDTWGQCLYSADYYTYNNFCDLDSLYLTAHPLNGTGPYTYLWATGDTTQTISIPLALGDYLVTITDAEGCSITINCHVKAQTQVLFYPFNQNACLGDTVFLFLDWFRDSIPGATYLWSTGETTSSILITDDITWSATVTDPASGCEYIIPPSFFDFHPTPYPEIVGPSILCFGSTITLTVTGGPFGEVIWYPGGFIEDTIEVVWPGTYTVYGSSPEANYCWHSDSIVITEEDINPPILSGPAELCSGQTGTISIDNSTEFTSFLWSNNQSTPSITVTQSGTYTVTVTNAGGCTASASWTIDPGNSNITITGSVSPYSSCVQPNGAVDLSVSPPGAYTYNWSNGSTSQDISNLAPGTYNVTVTDNGGCSSTASFLVEDDTSPPSPGATPTSSTCDQPNGSIDLNVNPPGSYTYLWSNGTTTEDLINILAGTYSVTVTSTSSGCMATTNVTVGNNNPTITVTGITIPVTSCTNPNGAIDITITPGGPYTFLWSNGATTEDISNLSSGNYIITVSAGGSCTENATYTIENNTTPPVLTLSPMAATCGQSNGALDLSVLPAGSYTYLWSTGATTEDLTALPAGTYSVTVTDILTNCTSTAVAILPDEQITIDITGTTFPNTLCLGSNGAVDINIVPSGAYSFLWSNGETTEDITSLPTGSYTITTTLGLTCIQTATYEVTNMTDPILITGNITPNSSCNQPNGAIDVSVDPSGVYSYVWSNGEVAEDISELTGGTYGITVTNNDGCTASSAFVIINTSSDYSFEGIVTPNTSCSLPNGNIDLILSPPGTYTFLWTNGSTTEEIDQLAAGSYGVTVSDINNCSSIATFAVADSFLLPAITAETSPETCGNNDGSIDVTVIPGNGNVFVWSTGSTNEDINNLGAGIYSLTVTASNGCAATDSFSILNQNSNFTTSGSVIPNTSCLSPNGAIDLTVSPPGTYTFTWSNTAVSEDISGLSSGYYYVTVTDISTCTSIDTFLISNNTSLPTLDVNITPAICGTNNGAIDLTIIPDLNMIYQWSNGSVTEDVHNLLPGNYSVTTTDTLSGCSVLDTFTVPNLNTNFTSSALLTPNTACIGPNGAIDLTVSPPGVYSFSWSNGATTEDLINLDSGTFTVLITDLSSCSSSETFVIINNTPDITITSLITPSSCGMNNGAIELNINPSAGNVFIWSNGATTEDINNLPSGLYVVTVTGIGGCAKVDSFDVNDQGLAITILGTTTANTNCNGANGNIDLSVIPNGAYSYLWSTGNTTQDISNLDPGNYTVTVSEINGCSSTASFTIEDLTISPVIESTITPSNCGNNNGQIELSILPVGTYLFTWSNGATTEDLTTLFPGTYAVTVTDINGCSAATSLVVSNTNSNFSLSAIPSANTSCTQSNGAINLTIAPSGTYTFLWSNGATSEDLVNIPAGTYAVTVTDISNCSSSGMYLVYEQAANLLVVETISPVLCGEANGSIDLEVIPPSGNSFSWSDGSTTEDINDILPGQYSVTVTGQNGCVWTSEFNVPGSEKLEIELQADVIQSGDAFVTLRAQVNVPLTALDTILWLPDELFECNQDFCLEQTITKPAAQTEIKVIAIDTNGCMAQASLQLDEKSDPNVYIPNVFTPDADGINDIFTVYGNKDVEMIDELQIFDRWGNQVFVNTEFPPNEENDGWDGSFKNTVMNPAVFAYWARVRYRDGTEGSFRGDVTLVR